MAKEPKNKSEVSGFVIEAVQLHLFLWQKTCQGIDIKLWFQF